MALKKTWTVYLIHHSHTDIGYTERQDKIMRYHCDFIIQAIDILNRIHAGEEKKAEGFVWQCENFWQVKNFYENASEEYIRDFEMYVRTGEIGLSGNYLNMTELVSAEVLDSRIRMAKEYGERIGHPVTSGMCADVNGMAWGYGDALYENGVTSFFTCIHPHHGMFPLYKKQQPFYWETPKGKRVLVWNGDYYHLGNELFIAPHGGNTYQIRDEYHEPFISHMILNRSSENTDQMEWEIGQKRLERYLENLEEESYPWNFIPFMVSGCITDNAPPSAAVAERVNEMNQRYNGQITCKMVNLEQFFDSVKEQCKEIPSYRGDWNDWWADGVGSTPAAVKVYLDGRRKYDICEKLGEEEGEREKALKEEAAENMMLYAEHTWGYSSSVIEPWESLVGSLEWKKASYAVNGNSAASKWLDRLLAKKGEISICRDKGQRYRIINPHNVAVKDGVCLYIELWEYVEGIRYDTAIPIEVRDCVTGEIIPSQIHMTARATAVEIMLTMNPKEERIVEIRLASQRKTVTYENRAHVGAEGVADLLEEGMRKDYGCVETPNYQVLFDQEKGICSVKDKLWGRELIRNGMADAPFSGIYEVTGMNGDAREIRRSMGRNRKSSATKRYHSVLENIGIVERGDVYTAVQLSYSLEGCRFYTVYLKIYEEVRKIEARVRIHKDSVWEPENLYIALPFTAGEASVSYLDKTGCVIRPGIDQLPGSCQDFYLLQNGVVWEQEGRIVTAAFKDAPMAVFGDLKAAPVSLCSGENEDRNRAPLYSWVMNNFWETNFKADLGGFYEFTYTVRTMEGKNPAEALEICEADNEGLLAFYIEK